MCHVPIITVIIPGIPVPKARPRTYPVKGGGYRTSTPAITKHYEKSVALWARLALNRYEGSERFPLNRPLIAGGVFFVPTGKGAGCIRVGDVDNYLKAVLDGFNGIIYDDDKRVIGIHDLLLFKYQAGVHRPGAVVYIYNALPPPLDSIAGAQRRIEEVR